MTLTTRAPLGRHLAAAALAGVLALVPTSTALAEPTPTPSGTPSASATPEASQSPTPTSTPTPSEQPSDDPVPSASPTPAELPTTPMPEPEAPEAGTAEKGGARMVDGGTARSFGPAADSGPATSTDPALLGAGYLERQLVAGGDHFSVSFDGVDYPDHGVTADAVLALDAAGSGQDAAARATAWLASDVIAYTGYGDPTEIGVGAVAKLLNVAMAQGVDPTAFGGFDLVTTLQGLEQANGRFSDTSAFGDYSNTFGQSFAIIGLHRASAGPSADAVAYLVDQQCPGGGFQLYMTDAGCADDASADPDATAMAVQALLVAGGGAGAASAGLDYLAGRQGADGGVGGAGLTSSVNANSTGLAGQAFLAGGRTAQARLAVSYLEALQYDCSFPAALRGGVAYDGATFAAQQAAGGGATPGDQDRRSTSQALLALAGTPLGAVTSVGADAVAPQPACVDPTSTQSPSSSASASSTSSPMPTTGGGASEATQAAAVSGGSSPTGSLAQTGSELLLPVGLGALLVLLGAAAVISSRRRGTHA